MSLERPVIALAGNPNVGKSSIFNQLTGLKQHTGNWSGKTVGTAVGVHTVGNRDYDIIDLPGTYSLFSHSLEEEIARNFICLENPDAVIVVCDATRLERGLNLTLQILEITHNALLCVNLMDEAQKRGIKIDLKGLSKKLGIPVVAVSARKKRGIARLMECAVNVCGKKIDSPPVVKYIKPIEEAIDIITPSLPSDIPALSARQSALELLQGKKIYTEGCDIDDTLKKALDHLFENGIEKERISDVIASCVILTAESIASSTIRTSYDKAAIRDRKIDKFLTGRLTGIPIMLLLFALIFYLTVAGANVPSSLLSEFFGWLEKKLILLSAGLGIPNIIYSPLICGVYHVLTWVISVMLPPMAIFFPLFSFLEDLGYLPRIAFNLDKHFKKCSACGKQALTMCMGFGCNAVGVTGCRIIDSPRERLIAILTNCFVPCNGRLPTLISIISMFFVFSMSGIMKSITGALLLTGVILLGIIATFLASKILSKTVLKGTPSSFTLELPPYRRPDIGAIIVRSILDKTLTVLLRAVAVAAPAGLIIWIFANVEIAGATILSYATDFLDPFGRIIGLDGAIILSFILGFPANETVIPILVMAYTEGGTLVSASDLSVLQSLLLDNGWTWVTAVNMLLFSLMHWPCSTTLLTIKKETGSIKWTVLAFILPTLCGLVTCFIFTTITRLI